MVLRRVVPSALLDNNRVIVEGEASERLPRDHVYVSPASGRTYDREKGDTVADLPPEAVEVPKSTWWIKFWRRGSKQSQPPPTPPLETASTDAQQETWYEKDQGINRLKAEYQEMRRYFPDFSLYQNESGSLLWNGVIKGIGEVRVLYPPKYLKTLLKLVVPNLTETENNEINQEVARFWIRNFTPAQAMVFLIRHMLEKK